MLDCLSSWQIEEAGYTGSRKELSEWLVAKGLWMKRETPQEESASDNKADTSSARETAEAESIIEKNSVITAEDTEKPLPPEVDANPDKKLGAQNSQNVNSQSAKPAINAQNNGSDQSRVVQADKKSPTFVVHSAQKTN